MPLPVRQHKPVIHGSRGNGNGNDKDDTDGEGAGNEASNGGIPVTDEQNQMKSEDGARAGEVKLEQVDAQAYGSNGV